MPLIDSCFSESSVEAIFTNLKKETSDFAHKTLKDLSTKSPSSLKVILQSLLTAKNLDFTACLRQELRLSREFSIQHDFAEGVRAILIDKDKNPQWSPSTLETVTPQKVETYFKPFQGETL